MKRARSTLENDDTNSETLGRRVEGRPKHDEEGEQPSAELDSIEDSSRNEPDTECDASLVALEGDHNAAVVVLESLVAPSVDNCSYQEEPSDEPTAEVGAAADGNDGHDASPPLSSAEGSMSEAPTALSSIGGGSEAGEASGRKAIRSRGLSRTILTLQQSHLWMGGKAVPQLDMGLVDPNTRVTRRMAAATTKQAAPAPETAAGEEGAKSEEKRGGPQSPSAHSRASSVGGTAPASGQAVSRNEETAEGDQTKSVRSSKSKKQAPVNERPDVKNEDEKPKVTRSARVAAAAVASAAAAASQPPARWKTFEAHVDHQLFESLRFVYQISRKAPVAKEADVIASSAHCTPRPLAVFTNMMLMYAPDSLLEAAGAKKKRSTSDRTVS